jgi:tRNA (cmo5U34)-methyltransferase
MSGALSRKPESIEARPLEFSFAAFAENFDTHIRQSIRGYDDLISDCLSLSTYFVEDGTTALDIGCSAGTLLKRVRDVNRARAPHASYLGVEIEERFSDHWQHKANISYILSDIRTFEFPTNCSFVTSIFSLQFISERERQTILARVHDCLVSGGGFVLAEKTLSPCAKLQDMITSLHYDFKREHFTETEILEKERSLRSLMKPWTERRIKGSLREAGFQASRIQCFWKNHNFVGLIALRS